MADTQEKKVCPCCTKHTMRSEEERKKLINRLKRVEGQIRGIIGMLENDAYCNDILIQSAAVNAAVNAFNKELLASHITRAELGTKLVTRDGNEFDLKAQGWNPLAAE